ncbi:hypothetical protein H4582DRAFT_2085210 [Lactarius indigo]|nr:hypothetical protein H4582DRAFT_2085210 [Lactarius indigo]
MSQPVLSRTNPESQEKAVELSWSAEFIGHLPLVALETHSSGMGQVSLVDEFSKKHFMIPINLRPEDAQGFPPADDVIRDFLTHVDKKNKSMHVLSLSQANHFFHALFLNTAEVVADFHVRSRAERIQHFRAFMSEGQSMSSSGPKRSRFYKDVITKATKGLAGADPSNADLKAALEQHPKMHQ